MGKEYTVQSAMCMCKFGAAPGILRVTDNKGVYMNGKLTATTMTLGNVFNPPGFGVCKKSWPPRPCTPMVTQWSGFYVGMTVNGNANPLTDSSKGTCAMGSPDCITFLMTGQIPIPGLAQMKQAAVVHQNDINPMGVPEALMEDDEEEKHRVVIVDAYWIDMNNNKRRDLTINTPVTLYVQVDNPVIGKVVQLTYTNNDDEDFTDVSVTGYIDENGFIVIANFTTTK